MENSKEKIGIIVDSFSGWDKKEANQHGILFAPLRVTIDGTEYLDGVDLSANELIEKIRNVEDIKTSAPTPGDFTKIYEAAFKKGFTKLLVIPCTRGFSITPEIARQAGEAFGNKVVVYVDCILTSTATQDAVINAKKLIDKGVSFDEVFAYIKRVNDSQLLLVIPKNLHALKRGGRVPKSLGTIMNWLRVIPIIRYDGKNHKLKILRTQTKAIDWGIQWTKEQLGNLKGYTCSLLCTQVKPFTLFVKDTTAKMEKALVGVKVKANRVSGLIAIHTGIGAVGILSYKL